MAWETDNTNVRSALGAADLSAKNGYAVVYNSSGQFAIAGAAAVIYGVLTDGDIATRRSTAQVRDVTKGVAGASISRGAALATNASGQFVTATSTQAIVAVALEAASGANSLIPIELGYRGLAP